MVDNQLNQLFIHYKSEEIMLLFDIASQAVENFSSLGICVLSESLKEKHVVLDYKQ